jgi:FkbM family methyltransferase
MITIVEKLLRKIAYPRYQFAQTYAQGGEDILIERGLKMAGVAFPTYLDIGTNHPIHGNNTYLLYKNGARGVCVEPNPKFNEWIKKYRPQDKILNIGVGVSDSQSIDFYVITPDVLSTFDKEEAERFSHEGIVEIKEIIKVPVMTINQIIDNNFETQPDLISVDVEGWNQQIIESFDFSRFRPKVFCIETITFTMDNTGAKMMSIINRLIQNDYWILGETYVNTVFIDGRIVKQRLLE